MSAGVPLQDADRWPWLEALAALIAGHEAAGRSSVLACSALKRGYRDLLRTGAPRVRFLHLHGSRRCWQARLDARKGHFFPPDLLASQFAALRAAGAGRGRRRGRRGVDARDAGAGGAARAGAAGDRLGT